MKILIAYASKTGTTERCAGILGQRLKNTTIVNLFGQDANVEEYDLIIIGSSIRIGMLNSKVKKFMEKNKDALKTKKVAYYICCGFSDEYKEYFESNISKELLDAAIIFDTFGGELDITKQKGFDKFVVNVISKTEKGKKEVKVLNENIDRFIDKIKKVACQD